MRKFCSTIEPDFQLVQKYLRGSFQEGKLSNWGVCTQLFSDRLGEKFNLSGSFTVTPVSSGHTALMAAYAALDIKRPLMPAYTFQSTYCAATLLGISPTLVDVSPITGCLELSCIEDIDLTAYDSIVTVCSLSNIPDLLELSKFCKANDKKLIVDAAATFGTKGIHEYADAFCISFHATKSFPVGEAGAVIADQKISKSVKSFINFGFDEQRNPTMVGMNAKVSEYTAAIGLSLLDVIDPYIESRLSNMKYVVDNLTNASVTTSSVENTVYQFAPIFMGTAKKAAELRKQLEGKIETLQYYKPLRPLSLDFPNTVDLYTRNVSIPIHQEMRQEDLDFVLTTINSIS